MNPGGNRKNGSGCRILIVGTGGQGALTAARLLCECLVERGHEVVSGQLHGMAQRGGSVQSSVLLDCGMSPVIASGQADCVLGFEPVETVRSLRLMSSRTVVYMNTTPVIPYVLGQQYVLKEGDGKYPDVEGLIETIRSVTPHLLAFDATCVARESGAGKTMNTVLLGCLLGSGLLPCTADEFWDTASRGMPAALSEPNRKAFFNGVRIGGEFGRGEGAA